MNGKGLDIKKMEEPATTEGGILTRFFRKIIAETGLINNLSLLINMYEKNRSIKKKKSKTTIIKTILDPEMTWKSFIFLIFNILQARKMKITVEIELPNKKTTTHSLIVRPLQPIKEDLKDDSKTKKDKTDSKRE